MEVDNARKERYFFAIIIMLALLLGLLLGIYYNKSPSNVNQTQTITIGPEGADNRININTATEKVLSTLPSIGENKAKKIIQYRQSNGNFSNINDLLNVDGIGKETIDSIKGKVVAN